MKRLAVILLAIGFLIPAHPASAYRERGDCNREGNCNDQRRCADSGDDCRGSFSPGPFDRSPVDVHDNCISLDCNGHGKPQPSQPRGFITNPAKLIEFPFTIVEMTLDFTQKILQLVV